jgi:enoyl-CoA hydratase
MAPENAHALIEQRGHVLIVTLNRPEARNALSGEMLSIMVQAWDRVDNDPDIRACILTGAGGYFCAGMDLKAATAKPPGDSFKDGSYDPSRIDGLLKGRRLTKPLIAAVEGPAIAGGTEILQGTDIRVAGQSAKFGISEARWSLYPMGGSAVRLVRADRTRGAGRSGIGEGTRDRRGDIEERSAGGAGDPALDPRDRGHGGE